MSDAADILMYSALRILRYVSRCDNPDAFRHWRHITSRIKVVYEINLMAELAT